jgi:hypothetical protein
MPAESSNSWRAFIASIPCRVRAHWRLKAILTALIGTVFTGLYLLIGHHPILPVRRLPLTWLDRAIGFHPYAWVWIYQSVYIPVKVIPWMARRREELRRYVAGFTLITLVSFAIFIAWPIRMPKPPVENAHGMWWLLQQYDAPHNSLPSLHASLLVFTLAFGRRVVRPPRGLGLMFDVWALLILYGTIATKEHYVADIVSGTLLGLIGHLWAWRGGLDEQATQQGADFPGGIEIMVGVTHGINLPGQVQHIAQENAAAVVGTERSETCVTAAGPVVGQIAHTREAK